MERAADAEHLELARQQARVMVTQDADFLRLHAAGVPHAGIVYAHQQTAIGTLIRGLMLIYEVLSPADSESALKKFASSSRPCCSAILPTTTGSTRPAPSRYPPDIAEIAAAFGHSDQHPAPHSALDQRNRQRMLKKVQTFWVEGVLERSLYGEALIALGLDAVAYTYELNRLVRQPDAEDRSLPTGTQMVEVFDQMGGELLILGTPGSGKTTMLRDLACAEADPHHPIPVVFNEPPQTLRESIFVHSEWNCLDSFASLEQHHNEA